MGELGALGPCTDRAVPVGQRAPSQVGNDGDLRAAGSGAAGGGRISTWWMAGQRQRLLAERASFQRDERRGAYQHQRSRPAEPDLRSGPVVGRTDARSLVQYGMLRAAAVLHGGQRATQSANRSAATPAQSVGLQDDR